MPRWMTLLMFAVVSISIQTLIHYYLWRRLVRDPKVPHPWRRVITIALVLCGLSMPLTMWSARLLGSSVSLSAAWPVFMWMGYSALLFMGFVAVDMLRLARWSVRHGMVLAGAAGKKTGAADGTAADEPAAAADKPTGSADAGPADPGRRQFMARAAGGAVVTVATGTMGLGMRAALSDIGINEVPVTLSRLPASLDGFAIVQLTDVHVGYTISRSFVEGIVARANAARPDVIAITGDLVDGTVPSLRQAVAPLGDLHAPHGVYFVTGNHEYYAGVEPWLEELDRLGIRVLRNERVSIDRGAAGFDLAGVDDYQAAQFGNGHGADLGRAVAGRDASRELVLLAHQPRQVRNSVEHGVGLQISGHTHGGQIWPWHYLARAQQGGLLAGLSQHGDTQLFISRGTGYWGPPVRVGAPAEIARVVLRAPRA